MVVEKKEVRERAKDAKIFEKQANEQLRSKQKSIKKRCIVFKILNKRKLLMDSVIETFIFKFRRGRNGRKIITPTKFYM